MAKLSVPVISHAAPPDEFDSFDWFEMEARVDSGFGELVWHEWVDEFGYLDEDDPRAITAGKELMRRMVHADDFDEFWRLAMKHRQNSRDLAELMRGVLAALAGRPIEPLAESSSGPETSGEESKVAFLRRVAAGRPEIEAGLIETAVRRGELSA